MLVLRMANRKWKETKQLPSMLPGQAVPGYCLLSFYILWAILSTSTVQTLPDCALPTPHSVIIEAENRKWGSL